MCVQNIEIYHIYKYIQRKRDRLNEYYDKISIYLARAGSVEDFCFGVWPPLLPNRLEADELILVFGERNDVVLVLKYKKIN
jgi:hypothetical protein